jgi:hypothetical protein
LSNDPYTALNALLQNNSNITSLLGTYQGGSIPLIKGGVLAETETDLPAITFYSSSLDKNFNQRESVFTLNCYANTERNSFLLASTIIDEYQSWFGVSNGYNMMTQARILSVIPDPTANEVNTAVEIRLINIGGA